ncbi:MAG: protein BatD [Candidatus Cloacimonetes bacterium]|nr:protein BatD [Candidatus Cloacimonadota bacterium]
MVNSIFKILLIVCLNLFVVSSYAAKLTLKSDQTLIPMGGTVEVQFIFEGLSNSPNLGNLDIAGFNVVGRSNSSSIQFINGKKSQTATISLQLRPKVTGRLTIGPYELSYNNQKLRSNQIVIVVDSTALQKSDKSDIFIEAELKKNKLVSGEQTLYVLKVFRPVNKTNYSRISFSLPETTDVILEEKKSSQKDYQKKVNNELYQVTEVSIPMFALKSGQWEIPPASVNYFVKDKSRRSRRRSFFDSFFDDDLFGGGKKKQSWTDSLKLEVNEIEQTKPANFSNLIGAFKIEQTLSKTDLSTDDNLTLKLKVTGIGNLSDLVEIPVDVPGFKIYPDGEGDLIEKKDQDGFLGGIKEFSYALVPNQTGEMPVGPFELSYFHPKQNKFIKVQTKEQLVKVSQGIVKAPSELVIPVDNNTSSGIIPNNKKKVKVLKHNILPLEMDYEASSGFLLSRTHIVFISIILIFITILFDLLFKEKLTSKKSGIDFEYNSAWATFQHEIENSDSLSKVFTDFALRKLKQPVSEKTPEELLEILKERKLNNDTYSKLKKLFEQEELNKYAGFNNNSSNKADWLGIAQSLHNSL